MLMMSLRAKRVRVAMVRMGTQETTPAMMMKRRRSTTRGSHRAIKIIMIWTVRLRSVLIIGRATSTTS
jgi:hypothetical protein